MSGSGRGRQALFFVLTGLMVLAVAVFELGRSQNVFSRKVILHASFDDISGLAVGAPVRLAGLDVGVVQRIDFDPELGVKQVRVVIGVNARYLPRIRGDSVARLVSKGLLGDTLVNISVGSAEAPAIEPDGELATAEAAGPAQVIADVHDAVVALRTLTVRVDDRVQAVLTDELAQDIQRIAHATAKLAEEIEHGRGPAHTMIYDWAAGTNLQRILEHGAHLTANANQAVVGARDVMTALRDRHGLLHELVYDEQSGEKQRALMGDLAALAHTLRGLGDDTAKGQGTIGALLRDPSVYEHLKIILGGIERNRLLKVLVRHAIKSGGVHAP